MIPDAERYFVPVGLLGFLLSLGIGSLILHRHQGSRSSSRGAQFHHAPESKGIPRLGGICLVIAFLSAVALGLGLQGLHPIASRDFWIITGSSLAIFGIGIFDDIKPLGAKKKLAAQILIASAVYFLGLQINTFKNPFTHEIFDLGSIGWVLTVLWLVAMTNLINLIDGIDGLAGGIGVLMMGLLAWVGVATENGFYSMICIGTLGGLIGFLRYNFPPARIYLGDGGAYFLGFLIGLLSIQTSNKGTVMAALAAPAIALALPIIDTTLAILRRGFKGLPLFRPDLDHIHHRLMRRGFSRTRAVLLLYGFSVLALGFAIVAFAWSGRHFPIFAGVAAVALMGLLSSWGLVPQLHSSFALMKAYWRLRWHSRYALTLGQWLQMEAERCPSVESLWKEYEFLSHKLQFSSVTVKLRGGQRRWGGAGDGGLVTYRRSHRFSGDREMSLEFRTPTEVMSLREFEHLTELAAEAWLKAVTRWEHSKNQKASFATETTAELNSREGDSLGNLAGAGNSV